MEQKKYNRFFDGIVFGVLVGVMIGVILGASLAKFIWSDASEYYDEVHYKYGYCPYCGEALNERR